MSKFLHLLPSSALALCLALAAPAQAESFEFEENFDVESSFSQGGVLPDGWSQEAPAAFLRQEGSYWGVKAHSGKYILGYGTSQVPSGAPHCGVLFTAPVDLAGGNEASIEFRAMLPGGNNAVRCLGFTVFVGTEADISKMTEIGKREPKASSKWEKCVYKFTPATDGKYYYAIRVDHTEAFYQGGDIYLDSFFFSGTKTDQPSGDPASTYPGMELLEPDSENLSACMELPYFENFSDASHYDGKSPLPMGWASTGTLIWRTAAHNDIPAASGDWYMLVPESSTTRDERAYTPFFNLQQGVTYTLTFSTFQRSTLVDEETNDRRITTIDVMAGTQQDSEFIPVKMLEISEDNSKGMWQEYQLTFCPAKSGAYTFCFQLRGQAYSGIAAIDELSITSPVDLARPEPDFAAHGIYNLMNSCLLSMKDDPVRMINLARYADEVKWDTHGLKYNQLPNGDIDVFFDNDGEYSIDQEVTNVKGTRSTSKSFNIHHVTEASDQMAIMGYDPDEVQLFTRNTLPTYPTDPDFDFVSGYNHYYNTYAERYEMPASAKFSITSITLWLSWLNYRNSYAASSDEQCTKPFSVKIYGVDGNGNIDESKCFGGIETTMEKVFGRSGTNELNPRDVVFDKPVDVTGPIYIVFQYSDEMDMHPEIAEFTRSYLALNMLRHAHERTSMYVKPYAVPEGSELKTGEWIPVSDMNRSFKGFGLAMQLWANYTGQGVNSVSLDSMGKIAFAARYADDAIEVSGTQEGEWIAVYNAAGACVAMQQAGDKATRISVPGLDNGLYIVKGNSGTTRFLK